MTSRDKNKVYKTYDIIGSDFDKNRSQNLMEEKYLSEFCSLIPSGGKILDLGCGSGKPIYEYLREQGFQVLGIDGSEKMIEMARKNFPKGEFQLMDMRSINFEHKFNGIIAWHSFFHLTREDQAAMFPKFQQSLEPQGILMFTSGYENCEIWSNNFGEQLYHSSYSAIEYQKLITDHGFQVRKHIIEDSECGGATVWIAQLS